MAVNVWDMQYYVRLVLKLGTRNPGTENSGTATLGTGIGERKKQERWKAEFLKAGISKSKKDIVWKLRTFESFRGYVGKVNSAQKSRVFPGFPLPIPFLPEKVRFQALAVRHSSVGRPYSVKRRMMERNMSPNNKWQNSGKIKKKEKENMAEKKHEKKREQDALLKPF